MPRSIDDVALDAVGKPSQPPRQEMPVLPPRPRDGQVDWPVLAQKLEKAQSSLLSAIAGFALMLIGVVAMVDGAYSTFVKGTQIVLDPVTGEIAAGGLFAIVLAVMFGKLTALLGAIVFGIGYLVVAAGND